ncbi:MFS transporter [Paracoccus sp. P2]|uniref:MFS family arabinose efflux permease n=1 Tax=Paracoccus pantotrophus TaxID=82367 RepID=A0A1I5HP24_PARPN|nr:MFS transporter [Paracoccus pantotrophus]MDF3853770.1 MFS transporter [Paracoccus pantotrophus]QFG36536.1 MHS family MFS transporter [Paracoccus pantotrophus]QLH16801.1 MFS transporter [Paracoccus pantotrophus]RDD96173.1 MFS transporter [Paracoccus pantotrophus]RKS42870.1 putative MFS family arabinose efflux permease [Paracoccus pantotrophus]
MSTTSSTPAVQSAAPSSHGRHRVSPSDVAVGVIIGRTSEFFDFFVFAIASVIVFPQRIFPFADPLTGTLLSFALLALAFVARPLGSVLFMSIDRRHGRVTKLTAALFLMGTATVAMGLIPSYENVGGWAVAILAVLRIAQGLALGGAWDGMPSLLALTAPRHRRGFYAMVPQLGAPIGLIVASLLFAYLAANLTAQDFLDWGWRYPFFVAFSVNVVALFARLRIVATEEFAELFESRELQPTRIGKTLREDGGAILIGIFVPLASFAMFHMVTVYPLSWIYLYTDETLLSFLIIEAVAATGGILAILLSGWLADRFGRRNLLLVGALLIGGFAALAPLLLSGGQTGELVYMIVGFFILGLSFGQSSGAVASLFEARNRYTGSAIVSDLAWMFGAGFAPLTALLLSTWLGLPAAGLYLLSGAVCSTVAILLSGKLEFRAVDP